MKEEEEEEGKKNLKRKLWRKAFGIYSTFVPFLTNCTQASKHKRRDVNTVETS